MYLHAAATPPSTSLIETLNDLDNNLIKDTFFKWMLLDRSSCRGLAVPGSGTRRL